MKIYKLTYCGLCLFFLLAECRQRQAAEVKAEIVQTPVTITTINKGILADSIEFNAVTVFQKKSTVKSTISGLIVGAEINPGDYVGENQLLFTIRTKEAVVMSEISGGKDSNFSFKGLVKIKSAKTGNITSVSHQKGDYVMEGDELAILSDRSSLVFMMSVPVEFHRYAVANNICEILLPDGLVIKGFIKNNTPVMDISSQVENFVVVPNTVLNLPENLIAKIRLSKNYKNEAVSLPRQAVLSNETQTEFWVMKLINDSTAVKIPVQKGIETGNRIEIIQPVFTGEERIILSGGYGLADTSFVKIK